MKTKILNKMPQTCSCPANPKPQDMYSLNRTMTMPSEFEKHFMYNPDTGEEFFAETFEDHKNMMEMGFVHTKDEKESDSYRQKVVKAMAMLDILLRSRKIASLTMDEEISQPTIAVYTTNPEKEDYKIFIAYFCPQPCYFDKINHESEMTMMQMAEHVNESLLNRGDFKLAKEVYQMGVGSEAAEKLAQKMNKLY